MRSHQSPESAIGDLQLDADRRRLHGPLGTTRLEPKAAAVLATLADRRGRVVTRRTLLDTVWAGRVVSDATLTVAIGQIRRAVRAVGGRSVAIETVAGRGYELTIDARSREPAGRQWLAHLRHALVVALLVVLPASGTIDTTFVVLDMTLREPSSERRPIQLVVAPDGEASIRWRENTERVTLDFGVERRSARDVALRITSTVGAGANTFRTLVSFDRPVALNVPVAGGETLDLELTPRRMTQALWQSLGRSVAAVSPSDAGP